MWVPPNVLGQEGCREPEKVVKHYFRGFKLAGNPKNCVVNFSSRFNDLFIESEDPKQSRVWVPLVNSLP